MSDKDDKANIGDAPAAPAGAVGQAAQGGEGGGADVIPPDVGRPELDPAKPGAEEQAVRVAAAAGPSVAAPGGESSSARSSESSDDFGSDSNGGEASSESGSSDSCARNPDAAEEGMPWTVEALEAKYGPELVGDMNDAELMLSYATRNGLEDGRKLKADTVHTLILAKCRFRLGTFSCERDEGKFRESYGVLARAVLPVTVVSLRDSLPNGQKRRWWFFKEEEPCSNAERACVRYRDGAFIVLTLMLVVQIYWTICSSLQDKIDLPGINPVKAGVVAVEKPVDPKAKSTKHIQYSRVAMLAEWIWPFLDENTKKVLREYKSPMPPSEGQFRSVAQSVMAVTEMMASLGVTPDGKLGIGLGTAQKPPAGAGANATQAPPEDDPYSPYTSVCVIAVEVMAVIQAWLLPLLYGALGAFVFVVRTLSIQARDRLFRKEGLVALKMRIYLGMIGGLGIGWFWKDTPEKGTSLAALSPLALAFVAGYGVELFFTLLDKIVNTFTKPAEAGRGEE
jgi:hypothetical protein